MKCMLCENYSLTQHICNSCQENFLQPSLYKRILENGIEVISFYKYADIKELLFTKHTNLGFHIYKLLASLSFQKFAQEFLFHEKVVSLSIDDTVKSGYSHTALLNKALKSYTIKPLYTKMRASSILSYSGKSKAFRIANPRNFKFKHFKEKSVILVDDIITTGTTLREASELLTREGKEILFCLTLCDVSKT
ncbi:ComF family protein [Sulfurimonas paralvinellae]|uniref:ComF family protein n=1 Tax=Sulfurimonas paralvinellae TaxID=317658 RepID=A0A7M1B962_9BACT|nr:phosphoribosyltransferase family protein [Sulfurimonas paralvinellae]QOP46171.1 ComF family protein [Sulfurimonas paralvinellae]